MYILYACCDLNLKRTSDAMQTGGFFVFAYYRAALFGRCWPPTLLNLNLLCLLTKPKLLCVRLLPRCALRQVA